MTRFAKWPFRGAGLSNASHKRTRWSGTESELALSIRERRKPLIPFGRIAVSSARVRRRDTPSVLGGTKEPSSCLAIIDHAQRVPVWVGTSNKQTCSCPQTTPLVHANSDLVCVERLQLRWSSKKPFDTASPCLVGFRSQ